MKAHELAQQLLKSKNLEVSASFDISKSFDDFDRRIYSKKCHGVNNQDGDIDSIVILFDAEPKDNYNNLT